MMNYYERYEPDVVLAHFGWRNAGKRVEQYRHYALSHGGFYGKYLRRGELFRPAKELATDGIDAADHQDVRHVDELGLAPHGFAPVSSLKDAVPLL